MPDNFLFDSRHFLLPLWVLDVVVSLSVFFSFVWYAVKLLRSSLTWLGCVVGGYFVYLLGETRAVLISRPVTHRYWGKTLLGAWLNVAWILRVASLAGEDRPCSSYPFRLLFFWTLHTQARSVLNWIVEGVLISRDLTLYIFHLSSPLPWTLSSVSPTQGAY